MKLFFALPVPKAFIDKLFIPYQKKFKKYALKWSLVENLHITLRFIGDTNNEQLETIKQIAHKVSTSHELPRLEANNLMSLPTEKDSHVLTVEVSQSEALYHLYKNLDDQLTEANIVRDHRAFFPHITIARTNKPILEEMLLEVGHGVLDSHNLSWKAEELLLYESRYGKVDKEYRELARFKLGTQA